MPTQIGEAMVGGVSQSPEPSWIAKVAVNGKPVCTGEIIAARWVLTAAHCLFGRSASSMAVRVRGSSIKVEGIWTHPDWHKQVRDGVVLVGFPDVGLMRLPVDVVAGYGASTLPIASADDLRYFVNRGVTVFGYGYDETGSVSKLVRKSRDGAWTMVPYCQVRRNQCFARAAWSRTYLTGGDSGGAWVGWRNGGWSLIAVHSGNLADHSSGFPSGTSPSAPSVASWIWSKIAQYSRPGPTTGGTGGEGGGGGAGTGGEQSGGEDAASYAETTGGVAHTWSNYSNAGGTQGPDIAANETVQIACKVEGFKVSDGNTWWYRIASSPWSNQFYVSSDAFYNNGATSGSLHGTPFVDPAVPNCGSGGGGGGTGSTRAETAGGVAHTWTDYLSAGGQQGPNVAGGQTVQIACKVTGFRVADGNTWWYQIASSPWNNAYYVSADAFYNNGATTGPLQGTPYVDPAVPDCPSQGASTATTAPGTYAETVGGNANTWTNYTNAGGSQGPTIPAFNTVQIACKVTGFRVADGNTWWYRIASSPWNNTYYVSADAFYNNGATSGSLHGTPFVDPAVPDCGAASTLPTYAETTGGAANTWPNPANAGGSQGPTIGANATVQIACKLTGFRVADGNTWWYRIASSPWNNAYYVSADAFYNNGQTSGSLHGTPFVDPNVPNC